MKKIITLQLLLIGFYLTNAQTTYTWNVLVGSWTSASSWTPARNTPASNDILVFNGSITPTASVTNIPRTRIGRMRLINNIAVRLNGGSWTTTSGTISRSGNSITGTGTSFITECRVGESIYTGTLPALTSRGEINTITSNTAMNTFASGTLTALAYYLPPSIIMTTTTSPALEIENGSSLILASVNPPVNLYIDTGATASISGRLTMSTPNSKLYGADTSSITIQSTGIVRTDSAFSGNPFTQVGLSNTHIFAPGSQFEFYTGSNLFGLSTPASKVLFQKGSYYIQASSNAPALSGRSYANFIYRTSSTISSSGSNTFNCDSLIIDSGIFNLNLTGQINIAGNIRVTSPGTLNFQGASAPTINFNATTPQSISGNGTLTFTNPVVFTLNNSNGLTLNRNLSIGNSRLIFQSGNLNLNGNSFTLGASNTAPGSVQRSSGGVIGNGSFIRWFGTANTHTIGQDTGLFPMVDANGYHPLWIGGTPTTGGTVSVSYNGTAGITTMTTPYSDNATNNVTVNVRTNRNWQVSTGNGFAGTGLGLRIGTFADPGTVNNPTNIRLSLASGIAPGTSQDGGGTTSNPFAERSGLTDVNLNNTFYISGNSTQNPLPATLKRFQGRVIESKHSEIIWTTASEINVNAFILQRSADGKTFEDVNTTKAKGNSQTESNYLFVDLHAFSNGAKTYYYRLITLDNDGSKEISDIIVLNVQNNIVGTALPNPVNTNLNVSFNTALNGTVIINVKDIQGKTVMSTTQEVKNEKNIDLNVAELNNGIYLLHISNNGINQVIKIQKN